MTDSPQPSPSSEPLGPGPARPEPAPARPRRRSTTIDDVARAAGVSRQTVSNALNFPHRVRDETLARVHEAIAELGYRPDQSARSLRTGERRTIGYLAPVDDPFDPNPLMGGFLEALVDAAGARGFRVLLFRPPGGSTSPEDAREALDEVIAARQVDGFVLSDVLDPDPRVDHVAQAGVPFVAFGRTSAGAPQGWVDIDNAAVMAEVVGHLAGAGHRAVAYVGGAGELPWNATRRRGFQRAVADLGLSGVEPSFALDDPADVVAGVSALLAGPGAPTAIAAENDNLALTVYEAVRSAGLAVGRDVAVTGFGDAPLCSRLHPALTSVRLPLRDIAAELVGMLLAQVRGGAAPERGVELAAEPVIRDSSR
jgi:DNA-binding LacI/PurR family transcriptional regulator